MRAIKPAFSLLALNDIGGTPRTLSIALPLAVVGIDSIFLKIWSHALSTATCSPFRKFTNAIPYSVLGRTIDVSTLLLSAVGNPPPLHPIVCNSLAVRTALAILTSLILPVSSSFAPKGSPRYLYLSTSFRSSPYNFTVVSWGPSYRPAGRPRTWKARIRTCGHGCSLTRTQHVLQPLR